ncbi:Calreticulin [Phytophthora fragariae]|uniref:Calreticulin n=1 Tax=Phytophthora fragariae TaxID=53985 RepID=A0A6A3YY66_9STRA|nr:Calreticulin [Phytophthora fragariae]KAE8939631.1 Calreticulin [Phytophthora fragariae]KAE9006510.1 Calreticulin [Phytophthora fragariae]KAE9104942.1 Calreticulin [Phytophthora fragariae]KAE9117105.1 Calreticulin [Phytophthora fragariae]
MLTKLVVALAAVAATVAQAETIFRETFDDADWEGRWVASTWKPSAEVGKFEQVAGKHYTEEGDQAVKTSEDARFYALSAKFDKPLNNKGKDLFLSYLVQHEQKLDCGGAYIKLLPADVDQANFGGESPYAVMFGPDICGSNKKTHAILNYARPGEDAVNMDHKDTIRAESDTDAHLYSFVLKQDNTYEVKIDGKSVKEGELAKNWPFQPEKQIQDPNQSKPKDWVDAKQIPDPEDKKPEGHDDIPKTIPDPEAEKPEDWDDEDDGEWEPAMIENPEYKGEWKPKMIDNPDYKGEWVHPLIDNPDYFEDDAMYNVAKNVGAIGFELWQVKSGTLFDDILVTDSEDEFKAHEEAVLAKTEAMAAKKKQIQDEEKAKKEAEAKAKEAEEKEDADDDEADEDEEETKEESKEDAAEEAEETKEEAEEEEDKAEKDEL